MIRGVPKGGFVGCRTPPTILSVGNFGKFVGKLIYLSANWYVCRQIDMFVGKLICLSANWYVCQQIDLFVGKLMFVGKFMIFVLLILTEKGVFIFVVVIFCVLTMKSFWKLQYSIFTSINNIKDVLEQCLKVIKPLRQMLCLLKDPVGWGRRSGGSRGLFGYSKNQSHRPFKLHYKDTISLCNF